MLLVMKCKRSEIMSTYINKRTGQLMFDPETSKYVKSGYKNAKGLKYKVENLKKCFERLANSVKKANESLAFYQTEKGWVQW